jgi:hypothetical protein
VTGLGQRVEEHGVIDVRDDSSEQLAMIVRTAKMADKIRFVTPDGFQQQVAVMNRPKSERIPAHTHLPVPRSLRGTQEVLIIQSGSMTVDIYDKEHNLVSSEIASSGDVVILISGGHGFTMIDDCRFIEVKQGPYVPGKDKEVFEKIEEAIEIVKLQ